MFKKRRKEQPVETPSVPAPEAAAVTAAPVAGRGLRITIGAKLVALIAVLLISSVSAIVAFSTQLFTEDSTGMIQQMNADKAGSLAIQLREQLEGMTEKMRVMGTILLPDTTQTAAARDHLLAEYYVKDRDFVGVYVFQRQNAAPGPAAGQTGAQAVTAAGAPASGPMKAVAFSLSPEERTQDSDGGKTLGALMGNPDFNPELVAQGEVQISTLTLADGSTGVAVSVPFISTPGSRPEDNRFSHIVTAVIRQTKFMKAFGESDIITTYLVDRKGKLLAHPEAARVAAGESVADVGVVRLFLEGKANNQQTRYIDPRGKAPMLGAFRVVGFGGLGVVAEVAEAKAFEAAEKVERSALYLALFVLSLAFFLGYVFSETISRPIRGLVEVARRISAGDFNIALKPRGKDEVANLSLAFNDMAQGLAERDRVKATFNKFHNKEIAEKLLSGEVKLGGERKEATIFFSDVRGFTAMSETMDPEQVVEMLNEYMTRMVSIIRKHNGVVDKYVGDAIMALWGVPVAHPDDTYHAVQACIEMRRELAALNQLRLSRGQNELKIGMGLNHGVVIAGNIGSDEKMEYTVIGDAVNTASRMESMTKEYGTDLLVPKVVVDRVAGRFIFDRAKDARVKGKTEALQVFRVKGYVDEQGKPVIVETPYSSYASEKSDKAVHDPNESPGESKEEAGHAATETPVVSAHVHTQAQAPVVEASPPFVAAAPAAPVAPVIPIQKPRTVAEERTQTLTIEMPVARVANGGVVHAPVSRPAPVAPPPQTRPASRSVSEKSNPFLTIQTPPDTVSAPPAMDSAPVPPAIQAVEHPFAGDRTHIMDLRIPRPAEKTSTGFSPISVTFAEPAEAPVQVQVQASAPEPLSADLPPPLPPAPEAPLASPLTDLLAVTTPPPADPLPPAPLSTTEEPAPASASSPEFATLLMAVAPRAESEVASVAPPMPPQPVPGQVAKSGTWTQSAEAVTDGTAPDFGSMVLELAPRDEIEAPKATRPVAVAAPPAPSPATGPAPRLEKVEEKPAETVELMPLEIMERTD